jgi:hypothetical protein
MRIPPCLEPSMASLIGVVQEWRSLAGTCREESPGWTSTDWSLGGVRP